MDDTTTLMLLATAIAIGLGVAIFMIVSPYLTKSHHMARRLQVVTEARGKRMSLKVQTETTNNRRKNVADTLKEIEGRNQTKTKITLRAKLQQAGLDVSENSFYIASAICGFVLALLVLTLVADNMLAAALTGFVGALGLPRWILNKLVSRRQNAFLEEFANAVDVIVRGVKSGLPLNECLAIIGRESAEPVAGEFREICDQVRVGVTLSEALERMMIRMPLAEVRFFGVVVSIAQQAGGNLSEALANLSGVLRERKKLQGKVKAMSAEAKASAAVLSCLPFAVTSIVYISAPTYIAYLWNTQMGQFMLLCAGVWMGIGVLVMKKMIAFKY